MWLGAPYAGSLLSWGNRSSRGTGSNGWLGTETRDRGLPRESAAGLDALEVSLQFGDGLGGVGLLGKIVGAGVRASAGGGAEAARLGKGEFDGRAAEAARGPPEAGDGFSHAWTSR